MEVEYIDETHQYLIDGVLVPSVSELLRFINPDKYKGIPSHVLEQKAQWGTNIHQAIEDHENGLKTSLSDLEMVTFEQYLKVREKHQIKPVEMETIVHYEDRYAGRLDMVADINWHRCMVDIKTTAKLDEEALAWQLGMYKLAYGKPIAKCYCLWLSKKEPGQLVEITPKTKDQILKVVETYENHRNA